MKLRNKKTEKLEEFDNIQLYLEKNNPYESKLLGNFNSLKQILEYYEDYMTKEPRIKDEKIRKFVRNWAEAFGVTKVYVTGIGDGKEYLELYAQDNGVVDGRIRISIKTQDGIWIGKEYTITELCGEEEPRPVIANDIKYSSYEDYLKSKGKK